MKTRLWAGLLEKQFLAYFTKDVSPGALAVSRARGRLKEVFDLEFFLSFPLHLPMAIEGSIKYKHGEVIMDKVRVLRFFVIFSFLGFLASAYGEETAGQLSHLAGPDLSVSLKTGLIHLKIFPGQDVADRIHPVVRNEGSTTISLFGTSVLLSDDSQITVASGRNGLATGDRVLSYVEVHEPLAPGASLNLIFPSSIIVPNNISQGSYFLGVVVDPANKISETDKNDNIAVCPLDVLIQIELADQAFNSNGVYLGIIGKGMGAWKSSYRVRVGSYALAVEQSYWASTWVQVYPAPNLIPVSATPYDICLMEGLKVISNSDKEFWGIIPKSQSPAQGPPGMTITISCWNCQSQGSKKVAFRQGNQTVAFAPIISWTNDQVKAVIPDVPPGLYQVRFEEGGHNIQKCCFSDFTVL